MYVYVIMDFPLHSKQGRREHSLFAKELAKDGFSKLHKNLFVRHCTILSNALLHKKRVQKQVLIKVILVLYSLWISKMSMVIITSEGRNIVKKTPKIPAPPQNVEFF